MKSFAKPFSGGRQSLLYLLGAAVQGLSPILVQPLVIRTLDATQWGRVGISTVMLQVGLVVLSAGLPLAITRAYFDPADGPAKARSIAGASSIVSLLAAFVLAAVWALILILQGNLERDLPFLLALPAMGLLSVVLSAQAILRAEQNALQFVGLSAGASIGSHTLGLLAVLFIDSSAAAYMFAFCIGMAATACCSLLLTRPISPRAQPSAVREAILIGLPVLPHSLAMILLMQGDSLLLKALQGDVLSGSYIAAAAFALGPFAVLAGLNNVWTPRIMAAVNGENFGREIRTVTHQALITAAVLGFGGIAGANLGIHVLAGPRPELVQLAKILPLVSVGYALYLISMAVLFALKKTGSFAYITLVVAAGAALVAVVPIQEQDLPMLGAVKVLAFTCLGFVYLRICRSGAGQDFPALPFGILMAVLTAAAACALFIPTTLSAGLVTLASAAAVVAVVAPALKLRKHRKQAV